MPNALYDPSRIDPMIELLRAQWKSNPHMRLGQLLTNITDDIDTFHISDSHMQKKLKEYGGNDSQTIKGRKHNG